MASLKARMAAFQAAASKDGKKSKPAATTPSATTPSGPKEKLAKPKCMATNKELVSRKKTAAAIPVSNMMTTTPKKPAYSTASSTMRNPSTPETAPASASPVKKKVGRLTNPFNRKNKDASSSPSSMKPKKLFADSPSSPSNQSQKGSSSETAKTTLVAPSHKLQSDGKTQQDWKFFYELALQFDHLKAQEAEESKNPPARAIEPPKPHSPGDKQNIKGALEGLLGGNFTANGDFLTEEFIGKHLIRNAKFKCVTFDFSGQSKLFKRFDRKDSERRNICDMFVSALLKHPQSNEITQLQMSNCLLPDEFLEILANKCIQDKKLPNLQVLNLESNLLAEDGLVALSNAIADPVVWPRLQFLKLENQKHPFTSTAEKALGQAVLQSCSLVLVSLRVRGGLERQQINNTVAVNIDSLRQARRHHQQTLGTLKERKRNEMEQYFDKIAADDPTISEVAIIGDIKFLGLNPMERSKTAAAFATNTHVKKVKLVKLKLDDAFAATFGKAIAQNSTLEQVVLDSNDFSGTGIRDLLGGLGVNSSIAEFQVRHQTKTISSTDEAAVPALLNSNNTITKLGIDLRNPAAKMEVDRKLNSNREHQRKLRAAAKNNT